MFSSLRRVAWAANRQEGRQVAGCVSSLGEYIGHNSLASKQANRQVAGCAVAWAE